MADPPGRPPPSPTMSQRLLGKEKRHSAIHSAAERGDLEEIKAAAILDSKVVNLKGHMGRTPLMCAARWGQLQAVQLLLHLGAPVEETDVANRTCLQWAIQYGRMGVARFLLRHGANLEHVDAAGMTPLHYAVSYLQPEAVKMLLALGASPCRKNVNGATPRALLARRAAVTAEVGVIEVLLQEAEATRELEKGSVPPRTPLPLTPPIALPSSFPTTASLLDSPAPEGDYPSHHPAPTRRNAALFLAPPAPASVPLSMLSPPPSKIPRLLSPQPPPSQGAPGGSREAGGAEMTSACMSTDESFQLEPNAMTMDAAHASFSVGDPGMVESCYSEADSGAERGYQEAGGSEWQPYTPALPWSSSWQQEQRPSSYRSSNSAQGNQACSLPSLVRTCGPGGENPSPTANALDPVGGRSYQEMCDDLDGLKDLAELFDA
ncbi:ankyrin repeat protein [Nannochloropsis gaditana]|uniref:Ankyrin repeat protein n=2 Tax=Nannochloropsis gaditana TaxID=72520 RepID=W7TND5_9STRA|nr:ankyrin repeat protein [Nannochloropsis gaditana]